MMKFTMSELIAKVEELMGEDYEVREMTKDLPNGIVKKTVCIKNIHENIGMSISVIDGDIQDVAEHIVKTYSSNTCPVTKDIVENIKNWEWVKTKLKAVLYNKTTKAEVFLSAKEFGFEDLIIVPYVSINPDMRVKVTKGMCEMWKTNEEFSDSIYDMVIEKALSNSHDILIQSLDEYVGCVNQTGSLIVSNKILFTLSLVHATILYVLLPLDSIELIAKCLMFLVFDV